MPPFFLLAKVRQFKSVNGYGVIKFIIHYAINFLALL